MDRALRILVLEDQNTDAELLEQRICKEGIPFSLKRVKNKEDFLRELKVFAPDFILSDYKVPVFDSLSVLAIAKEHCPDALFIFVSSTIEELAIEDKVF